MKLFMRRLCPTLILHGEADPTVPVQPRPTTCNACLEEKGIPYEIKIYPGAGHGFEDQTIWRDGGREPADLSKKYLGRTAQPNERITAQTQIRDSRNGALSKRAGSITTAQTRASAPWTAIPSRRKGSDHNHTMG